MTLKQYLKLKHVVVSASGGRQRAIEQVLARHNCKRDVQLKVPYYTLVGSIIAQTDLVATIPQRLAINLLKTSKVKIVRAPIEFPEFNYVQVWHPRHDLDPAHKWLRELIKKTSTRET